jgi:hypothetical protein
VDHIVATGAAAWPGVHITAVGGVGTITILHAFSSGNGRFANRKTFQCRACDANSDGNAAAHRDTDPVYTIANTSPDLNANSNTNPNPYANANADPNANSDTNANANANPDPRAPDLQPRVRHRYGERGVDQPDR